MNQHEELRVMGYARISFDPKRSTEAMRGLGVARQEEMLHQWAAANGYTISAVISDNDISASSRSSKRRPGWDRLLTAIENREVDLIACSSLDRLSRRPRELEELIDLLERSEVRIATLSGSLDLSTSSGRMIARLLGAVAANESDMTSDRLKARLRQDAAAGRAHWSTRPFGFQRNTDGSVSIVEQEAEILRHGLTMRLAGSSYAAITVELQQLCRDRGLPTISSGAMRRTLTSPRNVGVRVGKTDGKAWEAIFTDDEHQALLDVDTADRLLGRSARQRAWYSGLFHCSCGHTSAMGFAISVSRGYQRQTLRCVKRRDRNGDGFVGCGSSISLKRAMSEGIALLSVAHVLHQRSEEDEDDTTLTSSSHDLEELTAAYKAGLVTMSAFIAASQVIETQAASSMVLRATRSMRVLITPPSQEVTWSDWFLALPTDRAITTARAVCLAHDARLVVYPASESKDRRVVWGDR